MATASPSVSVGSETSAAEVRERIARTLPDIIRIRHDLHAHPELAYAEHRTAAVVATELGRLGIQHIAGLAGGTGVLGYLPATGGGNGTSEIAASQGHGSIALRADMDALPITEQTGVPYASTVPGVMHACGHDGHTANLLGVARILAALPHRPNPVHLLFQPAEEGGAGAKRMCEDGCLDGSRLGPPVRRIFGLHGWPQFDVGVVGSMPGPMLAATDNYTIRVIGEQSHAAYPQLSRDPIVAAAAVVQALQTICSRNTSPFDSIVVSTTILRAGTANNIIPRECELAGTVRTLTPRMRAMARDRLHGLAQHTACAYGCEAEIDWHDGYPVTRNDEATTERFFRIARRILGEDRVAVLEHPTMGGEDFAFYREHVAAGAACFFILGVRPPGTAGDRCPSLHQPEYNFNDAALATGMELMVSLALDPS